MLFFHTFILLIIMISIGLTTAVAPGILPQLPSTINTSNLEIKRDSTFNDLNILNPTIITSTTSLLPTPTPTATDTVTNPTPVLTSTTSSPTVEPTGTMTFSRRQINPGERCITDGDFFNAYTSRVFAAIGGTGWAIIVITCVYMLIQRQRKMRVAAETAAAAAAEEAKRIPHYPIRPW